MLSDDRRERFACETDCPFVGTTAAILIGAGIAAAGGIGSAAIQSHATGKAVDAQQKATDQAIQNLKPFQDTGTQAFQTLGGLMGLGGGPSAGAASAGGPQYDPAITPAMANFDHYSPQGGYIGKDQPLSEQMSNPHVNTDPSGYTAAQHGAQLPSSSSYASQTYGADGGSLGGMMKVRTPDGRVVQVPAEKVGEAQQNGGTVLGRV